MSRRFFGSAGWAAVISGVFAAIAAAQVPHFEGPITYQVTPATGSPYSITYLIKGSKIRFEVSGNGSAQYQYVPVNDVPAMTPGGGAMGGYGGGVGGGAMVSSAPVMVPTAASSGAAAEVLDWSTGNGLKFQPSLKTYTHTSNPADSIIANRIVNVEITKLDTKETIAGLTCTDYALKDSTRADTTAMMCVAASPSYGYVMAVKGPVQGVEGIPLTLQFVAAHFTRLSGFLPLKYVTMVQGKPAGQFVATSVKRKVLAENLFDIPDGYSESK